MQKYNASLLAASRTLNIALHLSAFAQRCQQHADNVVDLARRAQPAGRSKLLRVLQARLGNPVAYTGSYPLYVGPGQYNVDPTVDPAVVSPINGGERPLHCLLCTVRGHDAGCS